MNPTDAMRWILCLCQPFLRLSQAKTLSTLAVAGFTLERASLAKLGRRVARRNPGTAKSGIKRVDRFVGNGRIEPSEAMRPLVAWLAPPTRNCWSAWTGWTCDPITAWSWPPILGKGVTPATALKSHKSFIGKDL